MSKIIKQRDMQKGFSFAFDGIVAAIVLFGVLGFITANSANAFDFGSQKLVQKQLVEDVLSTGIKTNTFQSLDQGKIDGFLDITLPRNYDYELIIEKFTPSDLTPSNTTTYGQSSHPNDKEYTEAKTIFSKYTNSDINAFYSVTLRAWLR